MKRVEWENGLEVSSVPLGVSKSPKPDCNRTSCNSFIYYILFVCFYQLIFLFSTLVIPLVPDSLALFISLLFFVFYSLSLSL
jgi:hypothetical protein